MESYTPGLRVATLVLLAAAVTSPPVAAADARRNPRVRPTDQRVERLLAEGSRRSPAFRSLVERLDRSSVIVYVGYRMLPEHLTGQLTLLAASGAWRYVRVEIECRQSIDAQIAALAHELQHAVEVAEGTAVDERSMQAFYERIGFSVDRTRRRFETDAAKAAGIRVRHELTSARRGAR